MKLPHVSLPVVSPLLTAALLGFGLGSLRADEPRPLDVSGFALSHEVLVAAPPDEAFAHFTGDIRPWWDHTFSESPTALVLEPRPGGHFYEHFDESGAGAIHATVTVADPGRVLAFRGPLGFGQLGVHFDMVHRFTFEPTEDGTGTRLRVTVHGVGEIQEGWAEAVQRVWHHFLDERFVPYVAGLGGE